MFQSQQMEGGDLENLNEIASFTNHDSSIEKLLPYEGGKKNQNFDLVKKTFNITEEIEHSRDKYLVWVAIDREVDILKRTMRIYDWTNTEQTIPIIEEVHIGYEKNFPRPKQSNRFTDYAKFNLSDLYCFSGKNVGYLPSQMKLLPTWQDVQDGIIRE